MKENIPQDACENKLRQAHDADNLTAHVQHGIIEDGMADDGGNEAEAGNHGDLAQRIGLDGADKRKRNHEADDSGNRIKRHDVEPDAPALPVFPR